VFFFSVDDILPTIVYNGKGLWVLMWQSQSESSALYFSSSNDSGVTWAQQLFFLDQAASSHGFILILRQFMVRGVA
jgi:hypothetical protein